MAIVLPLRRVPRLKREKWRIRQMCLDSKFWTLIALRGTISQSTVDPINYITIQNVLNFIDQPVKVTFTFRK